MQGDLFQCNAMMISILPIRLLMLLMLCGFFFASCAPTTFVKPLARNEQAVKLAVGGELTKVGDLTIPLPLLSATYGRGITDAVTVYGSTNITTLLYGTAMIDAGALVQVVEQEGLRPSVSISPSAAFAWGLAEGNAKLWPKLDVNAYYRYGRRGHFGYLSVNSWFELAGERAHGYKQPRHWLLSPALGHVFVFPRMEYQVETKWVAANAPADDLAVEYVSPAGQGAIGIYFGITRKFNTRK